MLLTVIGLSLDIVGVVIVFRHGLPPAVNRSGAQLLAVAPPDPEGPKAAARHILISKVGLSLIILGFALQIVGALLGNR